MRSPCARPRQALGVRTIADLARQAPTPVDRRRLGVLRPARMAAIAQRLRPRASVSERQMQPTFMYRARRRRGRRDRRLFQRRPDRAVRPGGARRSEARDPALRRDPAGLAETRGDQCCSTPCVPWSALSTSSSCGPPICARSMAQTPRRKKRRAGCGRSFSGESRLRAKCSPPALLREALFK